MSFPHEELCKEYGVDGATFFSLIDGIRRKEARPSCKADYGPDGFPAAKHPLSLSASAKLIS